MNVREACGCDPEDPSPYCTHGAYKGEPAPAPFRLEGGRFVNSPRSVAPESRDEALRRGSEGVSRPTRDDVVRNSLASTRAAMRPTVEAHRRALEDRRLYEPAPSPELRTAATDAVREVFITELCGRLDAIYEAAKELGGAVGEQIRSLAGNGTGYSVVDGVEHFGRLNVEGPTKEHHAPLGDFSDRVHHKDEPS